ncbi:MAG: cupin domain-containing protein, partial [Hyphomicrobiaceae bacterium]
MDDPKHDFPAVRRVVTGHDARGRSVVLIDGDAANTRQRDAHTKATTLWITDSSPTGFLGDDDNSEIKSGFAPPPQGSRFGILDLAPGNRRFMHCTDTVDYVICLEGPVQLVLDDSEVTLHRGDIVVQRGTNHAWMNSGKMHAR